MSNNPNAQRQHAIKVVGQEIKILAEKINATTGNERAALEIEMQNLMDSIGLKWDGPIPQPTLATTGAESTDNIQVGGVGKAILKAMTEAPHMAGKNVDDLAAAANKQIDAAVNGLSRWQRVKLCYSDNKKKFWAAFALVVGAAAGAAYYFVKMKNSEAVSSVLAMAETGAPEVTPETTTEATSASIFTRIGEWIVNATKATKDFVVTNVAKFVGWVKGFFNNKQETTNGQPEVAAPGEAVPA